MATRTTSASSWEKINEDLTVWSRARMAYGLSFSPFCGLDFQLHPFAAGIAFHDFGAKLEFHALLFQYLLGCF